MSALNTVSPVPVTGPKARAAPLIAVDDYELRSPGEIVATKAVRADDPYLAGHYPDFTIYPGVFVVESVTQTVRIYAEQALEAPHDVELTAVASVRFSRPLLPGDTLRVRCECTRSGDLLDVRAECRNAAGETAARMRLTFRLTGGADDVA